MEKHIHESNLIEGIDDVEQDIQSMIAWKWLSDQRHLTSAVVKRLHKLITDKQPDLEAKYKGEWRDIQVYVGNHIPPRPGLIKSAMARWVKTCLDADLSPRESHIRFETIHPFVDGNGRTGRMLMWWIEKQKGLEPTFLKASERWIYYRWFKGRGNALEQMDLIQQLGALRTEDYDDYKKKQKDMRDYS